MFFNRQKQLIIIVSLPENTLNKSFKNKTLKK